MDDKSFVIPKLKGFKRDSNGKIVPVLNRRSSERIQHPQVISNLVNHDGYHLILSTERNPFTALSAFTSGMGLAYVGDDLKLCEPFGFNRLKARHLLVSALKTEVNTKRILHPPVTDSSNFRNKEIF